MASKTSISRSMFATIMASLCQFALAQDVVLEVNTTVGSDKPQASEHRITAGTEVAMYTGALYRVTVKPTVKSKVSVELSFKVLDVASGATVAAPTIHAQVGKVATYVYGRCSSPDCVAQSLDAEDPRKLPMEGKLKIDVTPSL